MDPYIDIYMDFNKNLAWMLHGFSNGLLYGSQNGPPWGSYMDHVIYIRWHTVNYLGYTICINHSILIK